MKAPLDRGPECGRTLGRTAGVPGGSLYERCTSGPIPPEGRDVARFHGGRCSTWEHCRGIRANGSYRCPCFANQQRALRELRAFGHFTGQLSRSIQNY